MKKVANKRAISAPTIAYQEKKCVRVTEADNGFSVSSYNPGPGGGEKILVAKNEAEAMRHVKQLLGVKPPVMNKKKR